MANEKDKLRRETSSNTDLTGSDSVRFSKSQEIMYTAADTSSFNVSAAVPLSTAQKTRDNYKLSSSSGIEVFWAPFYEMLFKTIV